MTESLFKACDEEERRVQALVALGSDETSAFENAWFLAAAQDRFHKPPKEHSYFMYPHHGGYIRVSAGAAWGESAILTKDPFSQAVRIAFDQLEEPASRTYLLAGKTGEAIDWPVVRFVRDEPLVVSDVEETLRTEFEFHAERWYEETKYLSSAVEIVLHPSYQRIIGMGPAALPMIFRDLVRNGRDWLWALSSITGQNPVEDADAGNVPRMRAAWLEWGRRNGYVF